MFTAVNNAFLHQVAMICRRFLRFVTLELHQCGKWRGQEVSSGRGQPAVMAKPPPGILTLLPTKGMKTSLKGHSVLPHTNTLSKIKAVS